MHENSGTETNGVPTQRYKLWDDGADVTTGFFFHVNINNLHTRLRPRKRKRGENAIFVKTCIIQLGRRGKVKEICTQQTSACTWRAKTAPLYVRDTSELVFLVSQELFLKRKYITHFVSSRFYDLSV